jgi:hypothetical protein
MSPRVTPLLAALSLALVACTSAAAPAAPSQAGQTSATPNPAHTTAPTSATTPAATASADTGNVSSVVTPDFSVEPVGAQTIRVTLVDPNAKAWSFTVAGTGSRAPDAWTVVVETSDVAPAITTTERVAGVAGDPVEQVGLETGDAKGRVCSAVLPVCVIGRTVVLPDGGTGTLVLELVRTDGSVPLAVVGSTAGWPSDPFVLGSWTTTEAFPWEVAR